MYKTRFNKNEHSSFSFKFTKAFTADIGGSHLYFVSLNMEKRFCCLEAKHIFDVTSKNLSRKFLN